MNILYTTGCPQCAILEHRLKAANISYVKCEDVEIMSQKGYLVVPILEVNGKPLKFAEALEWIVNREGV